MSFSEKLAKKDKQRIQFKEPSLKDYIILYDLIKSAKHHYPNSPYGNIASAMIEFLSVDHQPRLFLIKGGTVTEVEGINFATGLEYEKKKGTLKFKELGMYHPIRLSTIISTVDNTLEVESLHKYGFLRTEITPLLDFSLLCELEDEPDYKAKYNELKAAKKSWVPPAASGEIYAIKREEILMATLAILHQNQKTM